MAKKTRDKQRATSDGFTLVEILIVVTILGILAAIAFPEYRSYAQKAKESAAKETLQTLRTAIERYAIEHNGITIGYYDNGQLTPTFMLNTQFTKYTNDLGRPSNTRSSVYHHGPYLLGIPENPLNNKNTIQLISDASPFPASPTGLFGWIYKPSTKEIRLDWPDTDSKGVRYYDY